MLELGGLVMPLFGPLASKTIEHASKHLVRYGEKIIDLSAKGLKRLEQGIDAVLLFEIGVDGFEGTLSKKAPAVTLFFSESARLRQVENVGFTLEELNQAAKSLAWQTMRRYEWQIRQLKDRSAVKSVALCAQWRFLELLRKGKIVCEKEQAIDELMKHLADSQLDGYSAVLAGGNSKIERKEGGNLKRHYFYSKPAISIKAISWGGKELATQEFQTNHSDPDYGLRVGTVTEIFYLYQARLLVPPPQAYLRALKMMSEVAEGKALAVLGGGGGE